MFGSGGVFQRSSGRAPRSMPSTVAARIIGLLPGLLAQCGGVISEKAVKRTIPWAVDAVLPSPQALSSLRHDTAGSACDPALRLPLSASHGVSLGRLYQCARGSERLPVRSWRKVATLPRRGEIKSKSHARLRLMYYAPGSAVAAYRG